MIEDARLVGVALRPMPAALLRLERWLTPLGHGRWKGN